MICDISVVMNMWLIIPVIIESFSSSITKSSSSLQSSKSYSKYLSLPLFLLLYKNQSKTLTARTLRRVMTQSGARKLKCVLIELGSSELLNQTFTFYFSSDEFKSGIVVCSDVSCCTAFTIRYVKKSLVIVLLKITNSFT